MSRTAIDLDACAASVVARIEARQRAASQRADLLREQAALAVRALVAEFGIRRAWLFGSLAWGDPHGESDVDLLVEGLGSSMAAAAERRVAGIIDGPVDLVRVEEAAPGLVERVRREGICLHDTP
jgi:predicted nucleotidyltransferase